MDTGSLPLHDRVCAEIRAEMGFQHRSVADLAELLNVSRQSAKRRYDGELPYSLNEIEAVADWLKVDRVQLLMGLPRVQAVAS